MSSVKRNSRHTGRLVLACLAGVAAWACDARQPYERYQTVVDRQMFGPPPPGFDPTKMPSEVAKTSARAGQELTKEQEKVRKAIRFSVLNVTPSGEVVVGFTDSGDPKNPLHYYLKVGETQNGWTVKEADRDEATMTIEKDGVEVTLKLGGDSAANASAVSRSSAAAPPPAAGASSLLGGVRSLRERRKMREAEIRAEEAQRRAEEEKARAAREEEANSRREAEREEQRKQLMQIQEGLRKALEAREASRRSQEAERHADGADEES